MDLSVSPKRCKHSERCQARDMARDMATDMSRDTSEWPASPRPERKPARSAAYVEANGCAAPHG